MTSPADFMRSYAPRPRMLCSEAPMAFVEKQGFAAPTPREQARAWAAARGPRAGRVRQGIAEAARAMAARFGALEIPAEEAQPGDVVLLATRDGGAMVGLALDDKWSAVRVQSETRFRRLPRLAAFRPVKRA